MEEFNYITLGKELAGDFGEYQIDIDEPNKTSNVIKNGSILITGKAKGIKYPFSDRFEIGIKVLAALIVLASGTVLILDAFSYNPDSIWELRVLARSMIIEMIHFVSNTAQILLNQKMMSFLLGMSVLIWLFRR